MLGAAPGDVDSSRGAGATQIMAVTLQSTTSRSRRTPVARAANGARRVLAVLLALLGVVAGIGWLYLIRHSGPRGSGPYVDRALPLQQLAGNDAQPLVLVVLAWAPVGLATGFAIARLCRLARRSRAILVAIVSLVVLWLAGAASDAITVNQRFSSHVWEQATRPGTWIAVGLLTLTAAAPSTRPRRRDRSGSERRTRRYVAEAPLHSAPTRPQSRAR